MKIIKVVLGLFVLALAFVGGKSLWPQNSSPVQVYYPSDFSSGPDGVVGFPTWNAATGSEFQAGPVGIEESRKLTGGGLLVLPPEASAENPVPAVVILHGSGGDWSGRSVYLANRLAKHGIAGFAVDTFVARDLKASDDYFTRLQKASVYSQIIDGFQALAALTEHPAIAADKIAVTGFSLGGAAALYSQFEPLQEAVFADRSAAERPSFSAYASFYAGCSFDFEDFRPDGAPVLIMMGEADESMSVARCQWLQEKLQLNGVATDLKVYPGAAHGWEQPYPIRFNPEGAVTKDCIMLWSASGENIEQTTGHSVDSALGAIRAFSQCSGKGYSNGLHAPTKEQSWQDFYQFLQGVWVS